MNQLEYNFEATSPQTKLSTINTKISETGGNYNNNTICGNTQKQLQTPNQTKDQNHNNVVYEKNIYNGYYSSTNRYSCSTDNNLQEKISKKDNFNNSKINEQKHNRSFIY